MCQRESCALEQTRFSCTTILTSSKSCSDDHNVSLDNIGCCWHDGSRTKRNKFSSSKKCQEKFVYLLHYHRATSWQDHGHCLAPQLPTSRRFNSTSGCNKSDMLGNSDDIVEAPNYLRVPQNSSFHGPGRERRSWESSCVQKALIPGCAPFLDFA